MRWIPTIPSHLKPCFEPKAQTLHLVYLWHYCTQVKHSWLRFPMHGWTCRDEGASDLFEIYAPDQDSLDEANSWIHCDCIQAHTLPANKCIFRLAYKWQEPSPCIWLPYWFCLSVADYVKYTPWRVVCLAARGSKKIQVPTASKMENDMCLAYACIFRENLCLNQLYAVSVLSVYPLIKNC